VFRSRAAAERRHLKANRPSCSKRRKGGSDGSRDGSRVAVDRTSVYPLTIRG